MAYEKLAKYIKFCNERVSFYLGLPLIKFLLQLVAVLLIGIAAYAKASAVITSFEIAGGIRVLFFFCRNT